MRPFAVVLPNGLLASRLYTSHLCICEIMLGFVERSPVNLTQYHLTPTLPTILYSPKAAELYIVILCVYVCVHVCVRVMCACVRACVHMCYNQKFIQKMSFGHRKHFRQGIPRQHQTCHTPSNLHNVWTYSQKHTSLPSQSGGRVLDFEGSEFFTASNNRVVL